MHIITQWQSLENLAKYHPFYKVLFDYVFQGLKADLSLFGGNESDELYSSYWQSSTMIILDRDVKPLLLLLDKHQDAFCSLIPEIMQSSVRYLLAYPEYTEKLDTDYYVSLGIVEDGGSGIFLVFHKDLVSNHPVLFNLVENNYDPIHD